MCSSTFTMSSLNHHTLQRKKKPFVILFGLLLLGFLPIIIFQSSMNHLWKFVGYKYALQQPFVTAEDTIPIPVTWLFTSTRLLYWAFLHLSTNTRLIVYLFSLNESFALINMCTIQFKFPTTRGLVPLSFWQSRRCLHPLRSSDLSQTRNISMLIITSAVVRREKQRFCLFKSAWVQSDGFSRRWQQSPAVRSKTVRRWEHEISAVHQLPHIWPLTFS